MNNFPKPEVVKNKLQQDALEIINHISELIYDSMDFKLKSTITRTQLNKCRFFNDWLGFETHYIWSQVVIGIREKGWKIEKKDNQLILEPLEE